MSKIAVTPCEGFTVKDHTGKVIPENGCMVEDSPIIRRRLREGLLVKGLVEDAPVPDPVGDGDGEGEGGGDDEVEYLDLEKMTVPQIKEALTGAGVEFSATAKKGDLLELLAKHLEAQDEE